MFLLHVTRRKCTITVRKIAVDLANPLNVYGFEIGFKLLKKKCEVWQLEKKFDSADETEEIFFKPLKGLTSRLRMYPFLLTVRTLFKYS